MDHRHEPIAGLSKIPRIAFLLGLVSTVLCISIGIWTFNASIKTIERQYRAFYLREAKILVESVRSNSAGGESTMNRIRDIWDSIEKKAEDEYICIVDQDSNLRLHTAHPETVGNYAGSNAISSKTGSTDTRLSGLVQSRQDYSGDYISSSGQAQLAAFSAIPGTQWLLGVHREKKALIDDIEKGMASAKIGFYLIGGLLMPLSLLLIFFTFHVAERKRKQAQASLRESERRFRYILDSLPDMIVEVDPALNVMWANRSALLLNPGAVGQACYRAFPGNEEVCEGCFCQKAFETGRIEMGVMYRPASKTAGESYWENIGVPMKDHDGTVTSVLEISRNVTERELSRKRELQLQKERLHSQKMESIGNLAGGIAHDFNNILASIIGYAELSLDEVDAGTPVEDNLQEIYTAGKRARDLVKQILSFARQSEEERRPVQPGRIAKEVLQFMRSTIPTSIDIKQRIDSESLIMASTTQIHQVLMNLCTNAAQAMEAAGGTLEVSVADVSADRISGMVRSDLPRGNYVEIRVSDTGVGIAPDAMEAIFEPYYTTKGLGEGTGMGLAVVQGIVKTYGGQIRVESTVGQGSTFLLYLPVTRKRGDRLTAYEPQELPTGSERILFVDDEPPIAKMGGQALERLGYRVTVRTSSVEALELFRARPDEFDLVITDMTMPNMTGDRLAVEVMNVRPEIPVILCTGYSKKISEEDAARIGIRAFAYKPVVKADLARTVREVLDGEIGG